MHGKFERKTIHICSLAQAFNGSWYWQCLLGNDDDLIATVRAENLAQALAAASANQAPPEYTSRSQTDNVKDEKCHMTNLSFCLYLEKTKIDIF